MLYGTTTQFLKIFGIAGLDDLPPVQGLNEQTQALAPAQTDESADAQAAESSEPDVDQGGGETVS